MRGYADGCGLKDSAGCESTKAIKQSLANYEFVLPWGRKLNGHCGISSHLRNRFTLICSRDDQECCRKSAASGDTVAVVSDGVRSASNVTTGRRSTVPRIGASPAS